MSGLGSVGGPVPGRDPGGELGVLVLGAAEVRVGPQLVTALSSPRLMSLLAFLILNRHAAQSRQHLAFLFWPDSNEPQARTNLRQALHHLRRAIPESDRFLQVGTRTVQWRADSPAVVDVVEFEDAAREAETSGDAEVLERARALYRGDLLPATYDDWVEPDRQRLRQRYEAVLGRLADLADERGDGAAAVGYSEQLLQLDPLDEAGYRRLMLLHARSGRQARALRVYHESARTLERELGVRPSAELVAEYEQLGRGTGAPRAGARRDRSPSDRT